eukprot:scaffold1355_cov106-Skeletonema_dohrnii-CCMP3373.AAC.6
MRVLSPLGMRTLMRSMRINKSKRIISGNVCRRYSLPLAVAAAVICTYLVTSHFDFKEQKKSNNNLRQTATSTATSSNALFGVVVPQGRAVALPSVRISAEESEKIKRNIYGGEGGEL